MFSLNCQIQPTFLLQFEMSQNVWAFTRRNRWTWEDTLCAWELSGRENKYSATELDYLVIMEALGVYQPYLLGTEFKVMTIVLYIGYLLRANKKIVYQCGSTNVWIDFDISSQTWEAGCECRCSKLHQSRANRCSVVFGIHCPGVVQGPWTECCISKDIKDGGKSVPVQGKKNICWSHFKYF